MKTSVPSIFLLGLKKPKEERTRKIKIHVFCILKNFGVGMIFFLLFLYFIFHSEFLRDRLRQNEHHIERTT